MYNVWVRGKLQRERDANDVNGGEVKGERKGRVKGKEETRSEWREGKEGNNSVHEDAAKPPSTHDKHTRTHSGVRREQKSTTLTSTHAKPVPHPHPHPRSLDHDRGMRGRGESPKGQTPAIPSHRQTTTTSTMLTAPDGVPGPRHALRPMKTA